MNNPPIIEQQRDERGRFLDFTLFQGEYVNKCFNEKVTSMAVGGRGTIMLFENGGNAKTNALPPNLCNLLEGPYKKQSIPTYVALGSHRRYYVQFEDGSSKWFCCDAMDAALKETRRSVKTVAVGKYWCSYFIVYEDGGWSYSNVPTELSDLVKGRNTADLDCVSLGRNREYFLKVKNGDTWWGGMSWDAMCRLERVRNGVKFVDFGDDDNWLCRYT